MRKRLTVLWLVCLARFGPRREFAPFLGLGTSVLRMLASTIGHSTLLGGIVDPPGLLSPLRMLVGDVRGRFKCLRGSIKP